MPEIDPLLDPDVSNRMLDTAKQYLKDLLRKDLLNLMPRGYIATQEPVTDPIEKALEFAKGHDFNLSVAQNPESIPGDRRRAIKWLTDEERNKQEIMGDAARTT